MNADLNVIKTTITLVGDEATTNVITLTPPLQEGQIVIPALSKVVVPVTAGTTITADIGSASNSDSLASGLDLKTVGVRDFGTTDTTMETFLPGEPVIATLGTVSGPLVGKTITFYIVTRSV